MHTYFVIDDDLISEAMRLTGIRSKKDVIEAALKAMIISNKRDKLAAAFGQYPWEGGLPI